MQVRVLPAPLRSASPPRAFRIAPERLRDAPAEESIAQEGAELDAVAYTLFFIGGLGFGYAAPGLWKAACFALPVALAVLAMTQDGVQGAIVAELALALVITAGGLLVGIVLDRGVLRGGDGSDRQTS